MVSYHYVVPLRQCITHDLTLVWPVSQVDKLTYQALNRSACTFPHSWQWMWHRLLLLDDTLNNTVIYQRHLKYPQVSWPRLHTSYLRIFPRTWTNDSITWRSYTTSECEQRNISFVRECGCTGEHLLLGYSPQAPWWPGSCQCWPSSPIPSPVPPDCTGDLKQHCVCTSTGLGNDVLPLPQSIELHTVLCDVIVCTSQIDVNVVSE